VWPAWCVDGSDRYIAQFDQISFVQDQCYAVNLRSATAETRVVMTASTAYQQLAQRQARLSRLGYFNQLSVWD
jgi:S-adenosylhomocysteine hydrolase